MNEKIKHYESLSQAFMNVLKSYCKGFIVAICIAAFAFCCAYYLINTYYPLSELSIKIVRASGTTISAIAIYGRLGW